MCLILTLRLAVLLAWEVQGSIDLEFSGVGQSATASILPHSSHTGQWSHQIRLKQKEIILFDLIKLETNTQECIRRIGAELGQCPVLQIKSTQKVKARLRQAWGTPEGRAKTHSTFQTAFVVDDIRSHPFCGGKRDRCEVKWGCLLSRAAMHLCTSEQWS